MSYIIKCKNIETAISRAKKFLIEKCKSQGLYENFGQNEVMQIKDKFINISLYNFDENNKRDLLQRFDEWCMNYNGR
jgi:hypothetical protein